MRYCKHPIAAGESPVAGPANPLALSTGRELRGRVAVAHVQGLPKGGGPGATAQA